jgi:membrane fusion protein (multidrug efflux system)
MIRRILKTAMFPGFLGLLLASGCKPSGADSALPIATPVAVKTALPHRGEIARTVSLPTFRVLAYQEATLYAKVSGYLKTMNVDKGDSVTNGQLLAEIEVPELQADEIQFQSESRIAETNYERMADARKKSPDLIVPQTVDDLRGQWEVAKAKLQRTQTLLQFARITAPFSGTITARFVDPGAYIPAATSGNPSQSVALATLMDFSRVRVQVYVPESEVPFIRNGVPVKLTVEELPGKSFAGSVTRFAYALDQATKTMLTEIELPNPSGELRPGMYASALIEVERKKDALLLPAQAVSIEKTGSFVFLVSEGKVKKVAVHTGFNDGTNIELIDPLKSDQPVAVVGKQSLSDGQPVTVSEEK